MLDAAVKVTDKEECCIVKVFGRATHNITPPIKKLIEEKTLANLDYFAFDLKDVSFMDSTFMGTLTMLALETRKTQTTSKIFNINEVNMKALKSLGVSKLFIFEDDLDYGEDSEELNQDNITKKESAETVLEAHKNLMEIDENNVPKFEKVVEFAEKDLNNMK